MTPSAGAPPRRKKPKPPPLAERRVGGGRDQERNVAGQRFLAIASILGLILSLGALYMAFDANVIARKANQLASQLLTDNVVPLSARFVHGEVQESIYGTLIFRCSMTTRLANLGGASSALVRYTATISFEGRSASVVGNESFSDFEGQSDLSDFGVFYPHVEFLQSLDPTVGPLSAAFPVQIQPFSVVEMIARVGFSIYDAPENVDYYFPLALPVANEPGDRVGTLGSVDVSFIFETASGKTLSGTPPTACIYLKGD